MQFAAFLAAAAAAAAQPMPLPERQAIVVTAPPPPGERDAREFVQDIMERSYDQVARYHAPVCAAVVGLEPNAARVVRDRILETARGVGGEVDPNPRCAANLLLVVADNGRAFVNDLRRNMPAWLTGLEVAEVARIANQPTPARAWSVVTIRNEDGQTAEATAHAPKFRMMRGAPWSVGGRFAEDAPTIRVRSASLFRPATRADIEGSVIVVERSAALGITLAQLADYAAMRGLARTSPPQKSAVRTILNLFEPGAQREPELTRSDILYLQTLYRSAGIESAVQERGRLARAVGERDRAHREGAPAPQQRP
jgi:hypothetical protein